MATELESQHQSSPAAPSSLALALGSGEELAVPPTPKEMATLGYSDVDDVEDDSSSDEFEFTFASVPNPDELPDVTADELFSGGRILPVYPIFNRELLLPEDASEQEQIPIRRLLIEDTPSAEGEYCLWSPKSAPQSPDRCKKSSSAGAGKTRRWRLSDLMGRSHSDGKEKFVFIGKAATAATRPSAGTAKEIKGANSGDRAAAPKNMRRSTEADMAAVHRLYYGKQSGNGQAAKEAARRSFLPYRQELYALFAPTNGVGVKPYRF